MLCGCLRVLVGQSQLQADVHPTDKRWKLHTVSESVQLLLISHIMKLLLQVNLTVQHCHNDHSDLWNRLECSLVCAQLYKNTFKKEKKIHLTSLNMTPDDSRPLNIFATFLSSYKLKGYFLIREGRNKEWLTGVVWIRECMSRAQSTHLLGSVKVRTHNSVISLFFLYTSLQKHPSDIPQ